MLKPLVIFGAGGHAKVVVDAIERQQVYEIALLVDADKARVGTHLSGYEVLAEEVGLSAMSQGISHAIVAIGDNTARRQVAARAREAGFVLATVIHPAAVVARSVQVGDGSLVMSGVIINAEATVGENVILNTGAVIEHDCKIGSHVHIAPHATLCGGVTVGSGSLVGAAATVLVGVRIGSDVVVGAASTVLADIADNSKVVGSPSRTIKRSQ